jgi:hypothetical protein
VVIIAWKFVESGKTGRVLLVIFAQFFVFRPVDLVPTRVAVPVEPDLDCLLRLGGGVEDECTEYGGINSETTRARENPHKRHGVAVADGHHCVRLPCIGYAGVPQRGEAYY